MNGVIWNQKRLGLLLLIIGIILVGYGIQYSQSITYVVKEYNIVPETGINIDVDTPYNYNFILKYNIAKLENAQVVVSFINTRAKYPPYYDVEITFDPDGKIYVKTAQSITTTKYNYCIGSWKNTSEIRVETQGENVYITIDGNTYTFHRNVIEKVTLVSISTVIYNIGAKANGYVKILIPSGYMVHKTITENHDTGNEATNCDNVTVIGIILAIAGYILMRVR